MKSNMNLGEVKSVLYKRITRTLQDAGKLVPVNEDVSKHIKDDVDYYVSLYNYNQDHYNQFKQTGTISGIEDVTTNVLLFDFDASEAKGSSFEDARQSSVKLVERLIARGVAEDAIQMFYSGNKGFHVAVNIEQTLTPPEFKNIVFGLAKDLKGFDETINNAARIIRLSNTKHNVSGLYKSPLDLAFLKGGTEDDIKSYAIKPDKIDPTPSINLPASILSLKFSKKEEKIKKGEVADIDLDLKPTWLSKCKYSLSQGMFKEGMRDNVFTALAATYKGQGLPEDIVYGMLQGVASLQSRREGVDQFEDRDLDRIVRSVFKTTWNGGTYTCKNDGWLKNYCDNHGFNCHGEVEDDSYPVIETNDGLLKFSSYAENIDKNTIKTGIEKLDKNLKIQVGHLVGMLAPPGIGKTSFALTILNNASIEGVESLFFSYDMASSILFQKLIQRETGYSPEKVFEIFKNKNTEDIKKIEQLIMKNYENVGFCFKSGQTREQIKNTIRRREQQTGKELKLIVIDYLELIMSKFSDPTQASADSIQGLREIANEMNKAVIVLLQPNKMNSKPDEPITSYGAIKGSSSISQATTTVLTAHRPGYDPRNPENDKFFSIDCVKSRMGPLFSLDFHWEGLTGRIRNLTDAERWDLKKLREKKAELKAEEEF